MSKSPDSQTVTSSAQIPTFLQPFLNESANFSTGALKSLGDQLSQPNALVTPFNTLQLQGQDQALQFANGPVPLEMQKNLREMSDTSDATALFGRAQNLMENPGGRAALDAFSRTPAFDGSGLTRFANSTGLNQSANSSLSGFASSPFQLNAPSQNNLQSTAEGQFLYGNPAFEEAVQASIRAARPSILSGFAGAGSGAIKGGLAQTAMQQAASDSFARLFDSERSRMQGAAGQLGNFQLQGNQQQIGAASDLNRFSLQDRAQQQSAEGQNVQAQLQQRALQQAAANSVLDADQRAGSLYSNIANSERGRALQAMNMLPQAGLLSSDILQRVGGMQQGQSEREKLGSIQQMQTLLNSSFGNINPTALVGQTQQVPLTQNRGAGILGGALAGSQLGGLLPEGFSLFGLGGGPLGAVAGGLLGAL